MSTHRASAGARLAIDSHPQSVAVVRAMLAGIAEVAGLDRERFDDLRTAVSEACNNVSIHAYGGDVGPLWVELGLNGAAVRATVLDRGTGIRAIDHNSQRMRVGLALISALASRAAVRGRAGGGTEVRMEFGGPDGSGVPLAVAGRGADAPGPLRGDVVVQLMPPGLLDGVLGRVMSVVATRAHFTVERTSDLQLAADELSAIARSVAPSQSIGFALTAGERRLALQLGPLPAGTLARYSAGVAERGGGVTLGLLTDELQAVPSGGGELLTVVLSGRHRPRALRCIASGSGGQLAQPSQ